MNQSLDEVNHVSSPGNNLLIDEYLYAPFLLELLCHCVSIYEYTDIVELLVAILNLSSYFWSLHIQFTNPFAIPRKDSTVVARDTHTYLLLIRKSMIFLLIFFISSDLGESCGMIHQVPFLVRVFQEICLFASDFMV
jgi:hypothetical protein